MANVSIDNLASEIMKGLQEYKDLATADMKTAVRKAGKSVKKDIQAKVLYPLVDGAMLGLMKYIH